MKGKQFQRFFCRFVKGCHAMTWLDIISFLIHKSYENIEFLISNELNRYDTKILKINFYYMLVSTLLETELLQISNIWWTSCHSWLFTWRIDECYMKINIKKQIHAKCQIFTFTFTIKFAFVFDGNNGHVTWFSNSAHLFFMIDR